MRALSLSLSKNKNKRHVSLSHPCENTLPTYSSEFKNRMQMKTAENRQTKRPHSCILSTGDVGYCDLRETREALGSGRPGRTRTQTAAASLRAGGGSRALRTGCQFAAGAGRSFPEERLGPTGCSSVSLEGRRGSELTSDGNRKGPAVHTPWPCAEHGRGCYTAVPLQDEAQVCPAPPTVFRMVLSTRSDLTRVQTTRQRPGAACISGPEG